MICGRAWVGTLGVAIPAGGAVHAWGNRISRVPGEGAGFAVLPSRGGGEVRGGRPHVGSRAGVVALAGSCGGCSGGLAVGGSVATRPPAPAGSAERVCAAGACVSLSRLAHSID